jgi:glycosyltransferase involved in cell wall biosynthesis
MVNNEKVSLILITYKHERFVREAIRSALSQSYQPLEIIVSDDCSPDATYDIVAGEVQAYAGPHKVITNRNKVNLGLVKNLEMAVKISTGNCIIVQAGDDISKSNRVKLLVEAWGDGSRADAICSDVEVIDGKGDIIRNGWGGKIADPLLLQEAVFMGGAYILGCAAGYSRRLFDEFPPISDVVYQEDNVLSFRALLKNGVKILADELVSYRIHGNNLYGEIEHRDVDRKWLKNKWGIALANLRDWEVVRGNSGDCWNILKRRERLYYYRMLSVEGGGRAAINAVIGSLKDGLTLRNALGILRLYFKVKH